jgi:type II secretory pathway pseudopilin PulG
LYQELSAVVKRLRRYKTTTERKCQNKQFINNEKSFYRSLSETNSTNSNNGTPTSDSSYEYWSSLWSYSKQHNDNVTWITEEITQLTNIPDMPFSEIITQVTKNTYSWKATGIDNLHNFWLKKFTCTHSLLTKHFNNFIK